MIRDADLETNNAKGGFITMRILFKLSASAALFCTAAMADQDAGPAYFNKQCGINSATVQNIQNQLAAVVVSGNGGLFTPNLMWSAVVDRTGVLCSVIKTGDAWPGSRAIAIAKASAANDFSNVKFALSTANLYGPTQPGGPLYGLNNSNPFNPAFQPQGSGVGYVPGGIITFGGGVALYKAGHVIGGLGVQRRHVLHRSCNRLQDAPVGQARRHAQQ